MPPHIAHQPHRNLTGQVTKGARIACGGLSDVYEGNWTNPTTGRSTAVAVKILRAVCKTSEEFDKHSKRLNRETWIWDELVHPNVLPFLGISNDAGGHNDAPALVSPLCMEGHVEQFLTKYPNSDRLKICVGIAKGLHYLHSVNIVHGDLKVTNVLIGDDGEPLLCDFGRSRIIGRGGFTSRVLGVLVYQAPELQGMEGYAIGDGNEAGVTIVEKEIFSDKLTKQTDVYAYAMVTLEVLTGKSPYYYVRSEYTRMGLIIQGIQLQRDQYRSPLMTDARWAFLATCWVKDPAARPNVDMILQSLA